MHLEADFQLQLLDDTRHGELGPRRGLQVLGVRLPRGLLRPRGGPFILYLPGVLVLLVVSDCCCSCHYVVVLDQLFVRGMSPKMHFGATSMDGVM